MKKYSKDEWGISETEYNRLKDAVKQNIILPWVDKHIPFLRNHLTTVDEIINGSPFSDRFHSDYTKSRDSISVDEFKRIVAKVLDDNTDVYSYQIMGSKVHITLYSRSKKSKWTTTLDFNDGGKITGSFSYTTAYDGATQPIMIGKVIQRRIHSAMYD